LVCSGGVQICLDILTATVDNNNVKVDKFFYDLLLELDISKYDYDKKQLML
jgi:hypothetical protein